MDGWVDESMDGMDGYTRQLGVFCMEDHDLPTSKF